jgi:hypothetical protein
MAISALGRKPFAAYKGEGDPEGELAEPRGRFEEARAGYWDPALAAQQRALESARGYGLEAEQMRTAAQQQLGAGIEQTRADLMAGAGARGLSPALGRAAGYAGGQLGQRGVTQARALQAQELAAAQAAEQQMLAQQAGLYMGMAEQRLGQQAAESQALQAYQALAAQQAAQQQAMMGQYAAAGIGAGGALLGQAGGWAGGGQQQPTWTPEYQQQYQQWAQTYSDRALKSGVKVPVTAEEARLINALRAEGARTESALQAATGQRGQRGQPTAEQLLSSLEQAASASQQQPPARQLLQVAPGEPWAVQTLGRTYPVQQLAATMARLEGEKAARQLGAPPTLAPAAVAALRAAAAIPGFEQRAPQTAEDLAALQAALQGAGAETERTLDALAGAGRQYEYTPQAQQQLGQPTGLQYGPMAQDLARTRLGRSAVVPTPAGLAVDTGRLGMISAGLIGQQEERIRQLEQQAERRAGR